MGPLALGELLCYCLSLKTSEIEAGLFERLSDADWLDLVQLAADQGLVPLLYRRLKTRGAGVAVPPEIWHILQETYLNSSGASMRLYHQLVGVLRGLQEEGIPVIVLKGAHLAQVVYGNPALRPMQDLDLLVKKGDLLPAEKKLLQMGYSIYGDQAEYEKNHFHFHYLPPDDAGVPVEAHWHIYKPDSSIKLDIGELWARAQPASIAGVDTLVLSPEDLILYQCIHIALVHLLQGGLGDCYDIAAAIQHYRDGVDWSCVQQSARRWGAAHCVYIVLRLARDLLATAVPDEVLIALQSADFDERLLVQAGEQVLAPFDGFSSFKSLNLAQFWTARRLRDKVTILLRSLFPLPETIAERYPTSSSSRWLYLYYLVNLKDMILEHTPVVWRLLRGDAQTAAQVEDKLAVTKRKSESAALADWLAAG